MQILQSDLKIWKSENLEISIIEQQNEFPERKQINKTTVVRLKIKKHKIAEVM